MASSVHSPIQVDVMPTLPVHALSPIHAENPSSSGQKEDQEPRLELARSASFSYISGLARDAPTSIKRTFSENVLSLTSTRNSKATEDSQMRLPNKELFRRASKKTKKRMSNKFQLPPEESDTEKEKRHDRSPSPKGRKSVTGTIKGLARKSWIPSRSSSPTGKTDDQLEKRRSWSPAKKAAQRAANAIAIPEPAVSRSPSPRGAKDEETEMPAIKHSWKPDHSLGRLKVRNKSETSLKRLSTRSSMSSFRSASNDTRTPDENVPPLPSSISSDRLSNLNLDQYKKKDPLWGAFRSIEGEYATFQSKTSLQKAKVLRTSLLPFLVKHAQDPSINSLRAEDLDRRAVILNKWWTALLDMLSGNNNQSITGVDRPAFLEAAVQIMMRPEWRVPDYSTDGPSSSILVSKSTTSTKSEDSDFLVESVHQNVRNIFVQNLRSQMAFVVDKLSLRSTPASLVTFGGKTCAYAFFFCPGMADFLVQLWRLTPRTIRRTFAAAGIERGTKMDLVAAGLASRFPVAVRSLLDGVQTNFGRNFQIQRPPPPGTENVSWFGPWTSRWAGRDSDLFFAFTKYYHILVANFLQEDIPVKDRMGVPGFVHVHAQILTVFEITLHRSAGHSHIENFAVPINADMGNPDALAPMPMTIANASRTIAENRLVILLRDILGDRSLENSMVRDLYTRSFGNDVKAAASKISLYNNDACIVLCDFMEEILPIISRHYGDDTPLLDWAFWLAVCQKMMQTETTLTQIRVIALVYTIWSLLIANEERKKQWVLGWILDQGFFEQYFCHWAPMVRHYFYRLLCWRVGRCDGEPSPLDMEIFRAFSERLDRCWAHYQYLSAEADMRALSPPSTLPCSPAPHRHLLVMRTDSQPGTFGNLDRFLSPGLMNQTNSYQRNSSVLNTIPLADSPKQDNGKKRFSWLGKLSLLSGGPGNDRPGEVTPPQTPGEEGRQLGHTDAKPISRPATPPHQAYSFRFHLELVQGGLVKERKLTTPCLPFNAQQVLDSTRTGPESDRGGGTPLRREVKPLKPAGTSLDTAKYAGRALAEWSQVCFEYQNFFVRRKQEGVPKDSLVETPVLGMENFKFAG